MSLRRKLMLKAGAYPPISVDDEITAWLNAVVAAGGSVSETRRNIVRQFAYRLKAAGIWDLIDHANPWWGENAVQARVALRTLLVATEVNSPTFEANKGYTGDGLSSYLNTGFIPATMARAITGGNQHIGAQVLTNVSGVMSVMGAGIAAGTSIRPRGTTNLIGGAISCTITGFAGTVSTSAGYTAVQRAGTTTMSGRRDDAALTDLTVTGASALLSGGATFVLARNNSGPPAEFFTGQAGFTYECAPLTSAQWMTLRAAILAFGQAVGAI